MYFFFWNQRQLSRFAMVLLLILISGISLYGFLKQESIMTASKSKPIYRGPSQIKAVALTFNVDWGEEYLPGILSTLNKQQVQATFFLTGKWAERQKELTGKIAQAGHELGNHGYSHPHVDQLDKEANKREIIRAEQSISNLVQSKMRLFAPPYGETGRQVLQAAEELGYYTTMWTIDTLDWDKKTSEFDINRRVTAKLQNGAIILMHPTSTTNRALPRVISYIKEQGYQFMTVSDILIETE